MLKRVLLSLAIVLVMSSWMYSQPAAKPAWKAFENKKLGVSFNYPAAGTASVDNGFFDPGSFTVWVKTERLATTSLWWDYHLVKKPGQCSDTFSKPEPSAIPAEIPKTKAVGKVALALSVDTGYMKGFGDDYTSLGIHYHGVISGNCWDIGYEENTLDKAPKSDPKTLNSLRSDFLRWIDSIVLRTGKR